MMDGIPYLETTKNGTKLIVDGKPFLILGGELHNSSGSDLGYLEKQVWPALRKLGGNCYLTPVYWECMEPEPGRYDFTLVDGVIRQAREEKVRLVLLWFGLWKNGKSSYVPAWLKQDERYYYMQGQDGRLLESVSPFCAEAVEKDREAFRVLMEHLRGFDREHTVLMIQVENEVGVWGHPRDYCPVAERAFQSPVPEEIASLYKTEGTWEDAFGQKACEYFMAWAFSKAVGRIAEAGKKEYPLPMFMNCVPDGMGISDLAGSCPSGGPVTRVHTIWRRMAPQIDLYGPDIYSPEFRKISSRFAEVNAFILPETGGGKDCAAKVLFSVAAYDMVCFSPFGIERLMQPYEENDLLAQTNRESVPFDPEAGERLAEAYRLIRVLWPEIQSAREEGRIVSFLQEGKMGEDIHIGNYTFSIFYSDDALMPWLPTPVQTPQRRESAPIGGGFIIQEEKDTFLFCGVSANILAEPSYGSQDQVFILDKRELFLQEDGLTEGRILNGDERNFMVLGSTVTVQRLKFYHRSA